MFSMCVPLPESVKKALRIVFCHKSESQKVAKNKKSIKKLKIKSADFCDF